MRRLLSAARKAGVQVRVEIAADGKIVVISGEDAQNQTSDNETEKWLKKHARQS